MAHFSATAPLVLLRECLKNTCGTHSPWLLGLHLWGQLEKQVKESAVGVKKKGAQAALQEDTSEPSDYGTSSVESPTIL